MTDPTADWAQLYRDHADTVDAALVRPDRRQAPALSSLEGSRPRAVQLGEPTWLRRRQPFLMSKLDVCCRGAASWTGWTSWRLISADDVPITDPLRNAVAG